MRVRAFVRAFVRALLRACFRASVCGCMRPCLHACVRACALRSSRLLTPRAWRAWLAMLRARVTRGHKCYHKSPGFGPRPALEAVRC
eukprot:2357053-Alexandrium_andersonii.AAC.1